MFLRENSLMDKNNEIQVTVFKLTNTEFEAVGVINSLISIIWRESFNGCATVELTAPVTEENAALLKKRNVLWIGDDSAAIIEIVKTNTEDNVAKFEVKGRTLESLLMSRIVWGTYDSTKFSMKASSVVHDIVNKNAISPVLSFRKFPFLFLGSDPIAGDVVSFQKTGGELYDAAYDLCEESGLGFFVDFNPFDKQLVFQVKKGTDRTTITLDNSGGAEYVEFNSELDDILSSSYYTSISDLKNFAYVAGEGEGTSRKVLVTGDLLTPGYDRREMYVDARDLQSTYQNENGEEVTLTYEEYTALLKQRGNEKLSDAKELESFEATVRTDNNAQYVYGKDYFLGDLVIVRDMRIDVEAVAKITAIEKTYSGDQGYSLSLILGYTIFDVRSKVK